MRLVIVPSCVAMKLGLDPEPEKTLREVDFGDETLRGVFEQCGFEYAQSSPSPLQRIARSRPSRGLRAALKRIRVNTGTFGGTKLVHEALWGVLRSYLSGEASTRGIGEDVAKFLPRDPTVAFLDHSFSNLMADSGITAYVEEEGTSDRAEPASRKLVELRSGLDDQLYTPVQAAEAWRAAMSVKIGDLQEMAGRIRFDVSVGVVQRACRALSHLSGPSRHDPTVADELFRLYGLDSPEPSTELFSSCDAVLRRKKPGEENSLQAFAVRGMGRRRSRADPLLFFRLFVEKSLKELGAGALVPFAARKPEGSAPFSPRVSVALQSVGQGWPLDLAVSRAWWFPKGGNCTELLGVPLLDGSATANCLNYTKAPGR